MTLIILGSEGGIGKKLRAALPDVVGIDRREGAEFVTELTDIDWLHREYADLLASATGLIFLATSPEPDAPDEVHFEGVTQLARLLQACRHVPVPNVVLASSQWAEPTGELRINTYGHSKRVFEAMAGMYAHATGQRCVALRYGWVPHDPADLEGAEDWLLRSYWDDERLIAEVKTALGD